MKADFRRETANLIKKINLSDDVIARNLSVTARTVYRWRKGIGSPHAVQFKRLKGLAQSDSHHGNAPAISSGEAKESSTAPMSSDTTAVLLERVMDRLTRIEVRLDQFDERLNRIEGKKEPGAEQARGG